MKIYSFTIVFLIYCFVCSCGVSKSLPLPARNSNAITGSAFYKEVAADSREKREAFITEEILSGNIPEFLKKFVKVDASFSDPSGKEIKAYYFVLPDYLSVGNSVDFARVPLTPMTAQRIADSLNCFLPTRKMVNDIYKQSKTKLEPQPMFAFRDSSVTFYQHHLIIEGQRKLRKGLISGIKKDVVISGKLSNKETPNRVAIYGWHKPEGNPIQQLYIGHANWYVDYSHGIRLVHEDIYVNGKVMNYREVLKSSVLRQILCDEEICDFYGYPYELSIK